ncbi:MAG TPA: alpha-ketoglutarate-dependent dioxygenase AlkB [Phenylobacterium sp.]|jgi:alkylated DNA repair dioxygenase AlkB
MPARNQPSLFNDAPALPEGFAYRPDFLATGEEADLAAWLATLPFEAFQFRGYEARRRVVSFGWRYDFNRSHLEQADDMPAELLPVRARAGAFAGLAPEDLQQCLLNEYLPGAPIGWHRDRPVFEKVVGVSLLAPCSFRLRRRAGAKFERAAVELAPRSAYLLSGEVRSAWEHSIPPVKSHRYSITFRNFRSDIPAA